MKTKLLLIASLLFLSLTSWASLNTFVMEGYVASFGATPPAEFALNDPITFSLTLNGDAADTNPAVDMVAFGWDGFSGQAFTTFNVTMDPSPNYAGGTFSAADDAYFNGNYASGDPGSTQLSSSFSFTSGMPPIGLNENPPLVFLDLSFSGDILNEIDGGGSFSDILDQNPGIILSGTLTIEPSWDQRVEITVTSVQAVPEPLESTLWISLFFLFWVSSKRRITRSK